MLTVHDDTSASGPVVVQARRSGLPVLIGLAINSAATYGFFGLASRALGNDGFGHLSALWAATFVVGVGFFQPFEQELSRGLSSLTTTASDKERLRLATSVLAAAAVTGIGVMLAVATPFGLTARLWGSAALGGIVWVSIASYAYSQLVRGTLAGTKRFGDFGSYLALEGLLRLALAVVLLAVSVDRPVVFGLVVAASFALPAALIGPMPPLRRIEVQRMQLVSRSIASLIVVAAGEAVLVNVAPLAARVVTSDEAIPGALLAVSAVARIPLVAFVGVRVALLPRFSELAEVPDALKAQTLKITAVILPLGLVAVVSLAVVGPPVIERAFGFEVRPIDAALVALSSVTVMLSMTVTTALIASSRSSAAGRGLLIGCAAYALALALPIEPMLRVEIAMVVSGLVAALAQWLELSRRSQ